MAGMTVSANATGAPSAAPASDFAETQALIAAISAEARASGKPVTYDPSAPPDDADAADAADEPGATPDEAQAEAPAEEATAEPEEGTEEPAEEQEQAAALDPEAIQAAIKEDGTVDLEALAKALGVSPEALQLTPGQFKAARIETRKAKQLMQRAQALSEKLESTYGDQVRARKAAVEGDLNPAIEFVEGVFGMSWNDLNRAVGDLLQGKPIKDLEQKRELRELKKREAEREAREKEQAAVAEREQQVADAKSWIYASIKADKLADVDLNRQLHDSGMPTVVDMVFEEMRDNYAKGLTDPLKALERVKAKLARHAKVLQGAGVLPQTQQPAKAKPLTSTSKPRASAQTGSAGNGRPMTDAELRHAVLREAGLIRK